MPAAHQEHDGVRAAAELLPLLAAAAAHRSALPPPLDCRFTVAALVSQRWRRLVCSRDLLRQGVGANIQSAHLERLQVGPPAGTALPAADPSAGSAPG